MTNRQAWRAAQNQSDSCKAAISHLQSGKVPSNKKGDLHNEIRHYVRTGILAPDGLLVTEGDQSTYAPGDPKTKIIVPHHLAAGVLFHLHNNIKFAEHPSMSQLRQTFNRNFHTWNLAPLLDELYKNCYTCLISQKQPVFSTSNQTVTQADHPHRHFHADVIRRERQHILLVTDNFSTFSTAMLINSEKADDLKAALILLTSNIRHPGPIHISTDCAPRFASLTKGDKQLQDLNITMSTRDELNKNYNAVVDHACQELEGEIRKLLPEGGPISQSQLSAATLALNSKLRRRGTLSAY